MVVFELADRIVIALPPPLQPPTDWRARMKAAYAAERAEGLAAARDFRRRMDEAYAAADFPPETRRQRGV